MKILALNKQASFNYFIEEKLEAGIVLTSSEVKSTVSKKTSINEAYIDVINEEVFLINCNIPKYENARDNHDEKRYRKLLLRKREITNLIGKVKRKGYTLIPLSFYIENKKIKVSVGICKGKNTIDKKQAIKERDLKRIEQREY